MFRKCRSYTFSTDYVFPEIKQQFFANTVLIPFQQTTFSQNENNSFLQMPQVGLKEYFYELFRVERL